MLLARKGKLDALVVDCYADLQIIMDYLFGLLKTPLMLTVLLWMAVISLKETSEIHYI